METKNSSIKKEDLIPGEFYVIREYDDTKEIKKIIHKFDKFVDDDRIRTKGYYLSSFSHHSNFHFDYNTPWISGRFIRLATFEERQWLETCIRRNKFVPFEKCKIISKKIRLWKIAQL